MDDTLTLREIAPPRPAAPPPATLKETALASFAPIEAHMRTLAARYKDVAYDVTTGKGMADAKAARLVLREEGRYAVQRLQERLKNEANDLKRTLDAKGDELIALVKPTEDAIHNQIEAELTRKAAGKAERDRIERERVSALELALAGLSSWIERCKQPGMTAERISKGIEALKVLKIGDDWAEFKARAEARKAEVLDVMEALHAQALQREEEAARLEAQRIENERVAAEQAERQRVLDAQAAELKRQADELAAAQRRAEQAAMRYPNGEPMYGTTIKENGDLLMLDPQGKRSVFCDVDEEDAEGPAAHADTSAANPVIIYSGGVHAGVGALRFVDDGEQFGVIGIDAAEPRDQTDAEIEAANGPEVDLPPEPATLNLGAICEWLGFTVSAGFLASIGVEHAERRKMAYLYRESQRAEIKGALMGHLAGL